MEKEGKKIIAVVTTLANGYAERELLDGIITENTRNGYATVVFSIVYHIFHDNDEIICEQKIYEMLHSEDISGIILYTNPL